MLLLTIILLLTTTTKNVYTETRLSSLRFPIMSPNKIVNITATCNATNLNITVHMEKPFKGLLSAKDFSQECRSIGTQKKSVNILIPTSGCGVRMSSNSSDSHLYYSVLLVVQQDKYLRQITDQETIVRCRLRNGAMSLKSPSMFEALKTEINQGDPKEYRMGRMRTGWRGTHQSDDEDESLLEKELENVLGAARAWMEIGPVDVHPKTEKVLVGEPTLLSIKSTLPAGIGWRVVDCTAHDGIGEVSQRLLDTSGCPLDVSILPALKMTQPRMLSTDSGSADSILPTVMRHQEAVTSFAAFKFPDRDRLHVTCALQLCRGRCINIDCNENESSNRESRRLVKKGDEGEVLDRLEVFNSVEVHAPGIELEDPRSPDLVSADGTKRFSTTLHIPGDRAFCVSPNRMAIAFCVLGVVFVVAVVVALCSLMRARRSGNRMPYYTRSLFSSSSGGSGYGGSKLLLHESPSLGQTRHWRIL